MRSPKLFATLAVVGSLAVSLVAAEAALRMLPQDRATSGRWGWRDRPLEMGKAPKTDPPNQLGLRGQPIAYGPRDFVVLLVGDSQVEAAASDAQQMPEQLLERMLAERLARPVKVFSLAASGWGQDQELLALRSYFSGFRADAVVLWATPGNDFWENAFPIYGTTAPTGRLKPTFRVRGGVLEGPAFADRFVYGSALLELIARAWSRIDGTPLETRIFERWIETLPPADRPPDPGESARCLETKPVEQGRFSYEIFHREGRYTIVTDEDFVGSRSHFSPYLVRESPRDRYLVDLSRRLYREIDALVRSNGATFRVFYPMREDFDVRFAEHAVCVSHKDGPPFALRFDFRRAIESVVDHATLYVFALEGKDDIVVSTGDRHLNTVGNARVMTRVADDLASRLDGVPLSSAPRGAHAPTGN